jgi:hypothetical protein
MLKIAVDGSWGREPGFTAGRAVLLVEVRRVGFG